MLILMLLLPQTARAATPGCVRLHVVAADDTAGAQALKLKVRDAVLLCGRAMLKDVHSADEAWRVVRENVDALEAAARSAATDARCETGIFPFPDRRYGDTLLPAGDYRALRVVIGPGQGHNWWCVLYPSLCYPEDWKTADGAYYSAVWNWLKALFGGDGA